jgi:hypothetical protein
MQVILLIIQSVLVVASAILLLFLYRKIRVFVHIKQIFGENEQPENLEAILAGITGKIRKVESLGQTTAQNLQQHLQNTAYSLHKVGVHKYNAYPDQGGNLSFSVALLDVHDNGIVITTLHGREASRVYIKAITEGKTEQNQTPEEQTAVQKAKTEFTQHRKEVT